MDIIPLLSIACVTYKHELFIEKTINGFLSQKTNFKFEIIICDDASPDKTEFIVNNYLSKAYPNVIIKYFRHVSNIGWHKNGSFCLKKCTGKYIAFCEGDDYWTDIKKIQKQVDFLEANPGFSICYHEVEMLNSESIFTHDCLEEKKVTQESSLFELLFIGNYIQTCSVVARNNLINFPFDSTSYLVDYVMWVWSAKFGKIYRIPEKMAVYRIGNGIWSPSNDNFKLIHQLKSLLSVRNILKDSTYVSIIDYRISSVKYQMLPIELKKNNIEIYNINQYLFHHVPILCLFKAIYLKFKNIFIIK
jgi:glycosyltransferase involved in cell wall biosynthesis